MDFLVEAMSKELPNPEPKGPPILPCLLNDPGGVGRFRLDAVFAARAEVGLARYGQYLHRDDGRPRDVDLVQELVDAIFYAEKELLLAERFAERDRYADVLSYLCHSLLLVDAIHEDRTRRANARS